MNAKFKELIYGDSRKMLTNKAQKFLPIITKSPGYLIIPHLKSLVLYAKNMKHQR